MRFRAPIAIGVAAGLALTACSTAGKSAHTLATNTTTATTQAAAGTSSCSTVVRARSTSDLHMRVAGATVLPGCFTLEVSAPTQYSDQFAIADGRTGRQVLDIGGVRAGSTRTTTIRLPTGVYNLMSTLPGHVTLGVFWNFAVRSRAVATNPSVQ